MPDYYHVPAVILTALFLPAFGYLYFRFRDTRNLLWFLGFLFALGSMALLYSIGPRGLSGEIYPWMGAAGQTCIQLSCAMFLGSLSPLRFRLGKFQVLFVVPYVLPLVAYSVLLFGVFRGASPTGPLFFLFPLLAAMSFSAGMSWGTAKGTVPAWLGVSFSGTLGVLAVWACFFEGPGRALTFIECINLQMAAVLIAFVFRRFSPGVLLSIMGFLAWSLSCLQMIPWVDQSSVLSLDLLHVIVLGKVVAAVGMIVLALEDELNNNKAAQERERRARRQLESYANLILSRRRVEDFDRQGADICETVVANSRFSQAALLLENEGRYHLAGCAGLDIAIAKPLGELVARIPVEGFLAPGSAPPVVEQSKTLQLDLTPWLLPGDDLERAHFTSVFAVPMQGRTSTDGALLLRGMRDEDGKVSARAAGAPRSDDLLPIEMLVARVQATRSQTMLFEKLIDSERFAGLGQLAGNVTQQLNSPLTVILGYTSLLEDASGLDESDRRAVEAILAEARRIRSTLESLSRVSHSRADQPAAISVPELLTDMEQLYRPEFLQRSIEFQVNVQPGLPRILCGAQQLRQAVLHCLQFAIGAVEREDPSAKGKERKTIRLEATNDGKLVQISVSHSGAGFMHPERAFDPFVPARPGEETAGMGLSLCATILRDQNGRASAVNLEPRGAAIILELRAA